MAVEIAKTSETNIVGISEEQLKIISKSESDLPGGESFESYLAGKLVEGQIPQPPEHPHANIIDRTPRRYLGPKGEKSRRRAKRRSM